MKKFILIVILFVLTIDSTFAQFYIEGSLSENFKNKVAYLDIIDSWDGFETISEEMILKKSLINGNGYFYFEGNELTNKLGYYRIRILNNDLPELSINPYENIYFMMTNNDTIRINNYYQINDIHSNQELARICKEIDSFDYENRLINNKRIKKLQIDKKEKYLLEKIKLSNEPLLSLFCLFNSENRDANEMVKLAESLNKSNYRPNYSESLQRYIGQENYENLSKKYKNQFYLLIISLVINSIIFSLLVIKYLKRKVVLSNVQWKTLTDKELEVLELIARKKSNKEMALELYVSEATIKSHVNNIYRKLGIKSRNAAIKLYERKKST